MAQQCVETLLHGYNSAYVILGLPAGRKLTIYLYAMNLIFYRLDDWVYIHKGVEIYVYIPEIHSGFLLECWFSGFTLLLAQYVLK